MTVPEQWAAIEDWMVERQAFRCRGVGWDDLEIGGSGVYDSKKNEWDFGYFYQCVDERTPYCFAIDSVLLKQTEDGWTVYDWGEIREALSYGSACDK